MKKEDKVFNLNLHPLIRGAIKAAIIKALRAEKVNVYVSTAGDKVCPFNENFYKIDDEVYMESCAIEKILGQFSWWNEQ